MTPLPETADLVIFDIDGTLHDAFLWWAPVIRRGLKVYAEQAGIEVEEPSVALAESVVGMKDNGVWDPFLPDEHKHRWRELRAVVLPMELDELRSEADYLFAGVRELLAHLRAIGVPTALASNCHNEYLTAMCDGQGLGPATDMQYCLDSEGVVTKTDMLRLAVERSGARHAVMIGDREPDLGAAREAGLPFVWRENSRCRLDDVDAVWGGDPNELLGILGLRRISGSAAVGTRAD